MERILALDGLRALAIAMVIGYHIDKTFLPAGLWGVILFFVLSGYLITRLLTEEVDKEGRIDLRFFYLKRGLRLYPPLLVVCLALLVFVAIDWSQVLPTLGLYNNYARIVGLDLGLLTHTWFIAVMAHYYLLWPPVVGSVPVRYRTGIVGLLALAAVAWRIVAIQYLSPGWVYNATDTNAAAFLAGCFLAVVRPRVWRYSGWAVSALLVLMFFPVFGEESGFFLWGQFLALALSLLVVQYAVSRPGWLEVRPIVWLGQISYGLYLWHYIFLRIGIPAYIALPITVGGAAISWYLLEKPLQRWRAGLQERRADRAAMGKASPDQQLVGQTDGSSGRSRNR